MPEKDINWEKLLQQLEKGAEEAPLSDAEAEVAKLSGAVHAYLQEAAQEEQEFPMAEGWERFQRSVPEAGELHPRPALKSVRYLRWGVAAAVAILLTVAGVYFLHLRRETPAVAIANLPPSSKVRLLLSNGKEVALGSGSQQLREAGGTININDTMIVYQQGIGAIKAGEANILDVPRGHQAKLVLADGTQVWVNADSRLEYPAAFNGSTREVKITGEAYFEVAEKATQPFIVKAGDMQVKVLGTAFNVNTYDQQIHTTLAAGKVSTSVQNQALILLPGEQATYSATVPVLKKQRVDTRVYTAWKDGDIYFEEATLKEIVHSLEREYDYTIHFDDPALERLHFTLDIRKTGALQDVLDNIAGTTGKVKFKTMNRVIIVSKK
ncbi:MAG: FecR domain-containing protein [Chitinophaga sp.]|nr:FecR domain-containing protein [Chitinophaga sp.]